MAEQLNLLHFELKPSRTEPPLWVERLVVWKDPSNGSDPDNVIRDIELQRGMNIVWSPDTPDGLVHTSGKTMFCRLLRYCLGEKNFAPEHQLVSIRKKLPNGVVGASVMIQGQRWVVLRNLRDHENDIVTTSHTIYDAVRAPLTPTGISPLTDAITRAVLGESTRLMPASLGDTGAWGAALAWATRDPECYGDPFKWRHPGGNSGSPVCNMSAEDHVLVARAQIGALLKEEIEVHRQYKELSNQITTENKQIQNLTTEISIKYEELARALGMPLPATLPSDAQALIDAAKAQLAKARKLPASSSAKTLADANQERDDAHTELDRVKEELNEISVRIDEKRKHLARLSAVPPEADAGLMDLNAICPACELSLEAALAKGCLIEAYLHSRKSDLDSRNEEIREEEEAVRTLAAMIPGIKEKVDATEGRLKSSNQVVALFDGNKKSVMDKEQQLRKAEDLKDLYKKRSTLQKLLKDNKWPVQNLRGDVAEYRSNYAVTANSINHMSLLFHNVLNEFFRDNPEGAVKLHGEELTVSMKLDGERESTSLNGMMTVAFDFAALAMSIEGGNCLPGFLIHDSPKAGDLGNSIYDRIFELAHKLELIGDESKPEGAINIAQEPRFQYIIATTTAPPAKFCDGDRWVKLRLCGTPAELRFLKMNL